MEESAWSSKNVGTSTVIKCEIDVILLKGNIFVHLVKIHILGKKFKFRVFRMHTTHPSIPQIKFYAFRKRKP